MTQLDFLTFSCGSNVDTLLQGPAHRIITKKLIFLPPWYTHEGKKGACSGGSSVKSAGQGTTDTLQMKIKREGVIRSSHKLDFVNLKRKF